jgi:hypothetical protein
VPTASNSAATIRHRHGVTGLRLPSLPGVAEVGYERIDSPWRGVVERADEEEQPTELVVGALGGVAVQRLNDVHVAPAYTMMPR